MIMAAAVLAASCNVTGHKKTIDSLKADSIKKDSIKKDSLKKIHAKAADTSKSDTIPAVGSSGGDGVHPPGG